MRKIFIAAISVSVYVVHAHPKPSTNDGAFVMSRQTILVADKQTTHTAWYDTIMNRINAGLHQDANDKQLEAAVKANLSPLLTGNWTGADYESPESTHLNHIKLLALAFVRSSNRFYNNEQVYVAITTSLRSWLDKAPKHKNWWYNDIAYPQQIGQILILMRYTKTPLPPALESELVQRMIRKIRPNDFANTSDEALHYLYRACLTHDKATLDSAVTYLFEPVAISEKGEGIQYDNSYFQHGQQQAIASYGRVFVGNSYTAASYLQGTPYAIPQQQLAILSSFFKNTYTKAIRGQFYDFNVRGRGISRKDSLRASIGSIIQRAMEVDGTAAEYWAAAYNRVTNRQPASYGVAPANNQYWKSSYTLHVRPAYTFSVQASSARTLRTERGNNENMLGKFLPDGATNIQRRGPEYANIMPVWEWDKIPGVTNRSYAGDEGITIQKEWGIPGTTTFTGGVSDGLYGVSGYDLNYDSVQARKAWFFFDNEVVCLGAGISSNAPEAITTTINQCWLNGKAIAGNGNTSFIIKSNEAKDNITWVLHDSTGYFFPAGGKIHISNETQKGDWYHINHFQSKREVSGNVFKLWVDHGVTPVNKSYAYIVVPGIGEQQVKDYLPSNISIVKNSPSVQAVWHKGLDLLQIVFYEKGKLVAGNVTVSVDKPCVVLLKNNSRHLYIADPTQTATEINAKIINASTGEARAATCHLPKGGLAGATMECQLADINVRIK